MNHINLTKKAIKFCGTQQDLADRIGGNCRQTHVSQWKLGQKRVSPDFAVKIERAVNGHVKREEYHPNLYRGFTRIE